MVNKKHKKKKCNESLRSFKLLVKKKRRKMGPNPNSWEKIGLVYVAILFFVGFFLILDMFC